MPFGIDKRFKFSGGHRLSKHKGRCFSLHGHNYEVEVGVERDFLDDNDMVIDFSVLKKYITEIVDPLDHCLLVNKCDLEDLKSFEEKGMRISTLGDVDPTAERIAQYIYKELSDKLSKVDDALRLTYVAICENDDSRATYLKD